MGMFAQASFIRSLTLLAILTPAVCSSAQAQVIERPSRPLRGLFGGSPSTDPNRAGQELTLSVNTLGSLNDDPRLETGGLGDELSAHDPGRAASIDSTLRYVRGRGARSVDATGRGYLTSYSTIAGPSTGGDLQVHGTTTLGRNNQLSAEGHARYSPLRTIGAFGSLDGEIDVGVSPDSNPINGFAGGHFWSSGAVASFNRRWTTHDTTDVRYIYSRSDYETGFGFDRQEHAGSVDYTRSFGRTLELAFSYLHSDQHLLDRDGAMHPIGQQNVDLGVHYRKRLSPTRGMNFSAGGGMTQIRTVSTISGEPFEPRTPSGHGGVSIDLGRSWAVQADYRRGVSVLDGITRRPFVTDTALLHVGGLAAGRRLELALVGGYSSGHSPQGDDVSGQYEGYTATAQGRYAIARWCAALVSYNYYEHRLRGVVDVPQGFATGFARSGVRVGLSFWLPLYGP